MKKTTLFIVFGLSLMIVLCSSVIAEVKNTKLQSEYSSFANQKICKYEKYYNKDIKLDLYELKCGLLKNKDYIKTESKILILKKMDKFIETVNYKETLKKLIEKQQMMSSKK